jgi:mRNA-degrading endonuclease RelE of RelBE toxin-antitoxin system
MYTIDYAEGVAQDLADLPAAGRKRVLDQIEKTLMHEPERATRNRKPLRGLVPPWTHAQPVWQLRVGEFRVFYDVDRASNRVTVRAVRRKPPHQTTERIL